MLGGLTSCCDGGSLMRRAGDEIRVPAGPPSLLSKVGGSGAGGSHELQAMIDGLKTELLKELRAELGELSAVVRQSHQRVVDKLDVEVAELRRDVASVRLQVDRGPLGRLMGDCVSSICGRKSPADAGPDAAQQKRRSGDHDFGLAAPPSVIGKEPKLTIDPSVPSAGPASQGPGASVLGPVVQHFESAIGPASVACEATEVQRAPLVDGLQEYARVLDGLGGEMGSYLDLNIKKLRSSKADNARPGYRDWLLSELPVHQATGYTGYVDDSAWMANLWIGWTLEFFVEFFAHLHEGKDTNGSASLAYERTLRKHHNFLQRTLFLRAVGRIPPREALLATLQGSGSASDVARDLGAFVALGRPLAAFLLRANDEMDRRMQQERKALHG